MNRMEKILSEMKEQGQKIIVCYYPLCDTLLEDQVEWAGKYFENGTTDWKWGCHLKILIWMVRQFRIL